MQLILDMVLWQVEVRPYVLVGERLKEGCRSGLPDITELTVTCDRRTNKGLCQPVALLLQCKSN
jgi:hypothetical protein